MPGNLPEPPERVTSHQIRTLVLLELARRARDPEGPGGRSDPGVLARHDSLARDLLGRFEGREVEKAGGRFLFLFERPLSAIAFVLAYHEALRDLAAGLGTALAGRAGIHVGEVSLWENPPEHVARGAKPLEVEGASRTLVARLASLAAGGQTLLTRTAYDLARRSAVGAVGLPEGVAWSAHGPYRFTPGDQVIEIYEVGIEGSAPFSAPRPAEGDPRQALAEERPVWRPGAGQPVPGRPHWLLERPAEAAFGAQWLATHQKTHEERAFRFAVEDRDLQRMKHLLAVQRRLRDTLGATGFILRALDGHFESEPFYVESEHVADAHSFVDLAGRPGGLRELPLATRLELVAQLAEALASMHAAGVALGDVRPRHLLVAGLGEHPRLLLAELSRGRLLDRGTGSGEASEMSGSGPEPYRAPELGSRETAAGDSVSPATDLYALGVILYQMVAADLDRRPGPFWERDVDDELLRSDVAALLEPSPAARFADPAAVARRLRALDERHAARREEEKRRAAEEAAHEARAAARRRWLRVAFAALAVTVAVLLAVVLL